MKEGTRCKIREGRREGEEVSITKVLDKNFVLVKNSKGKERKASIKHLEPLN